MARGALLLLSLVAACGEPERHLVVHMGEPMVVTVGASVGYTPEWVDQLGDEPADFPRGTSYVDATTAKILVKGREVFAVAGALRMTVDTDHGVVNDTEIRSGLEVPLADAPALVRRLRDEFQGRGYEDPPVRPFVEPSADVWAKCAHAWTEEEERRDVWGHMNRSPFLHLLHPAGVHLGIEFRCFQSVDGAPWKVSAFFRFRTQASCCEFGYPKVERQRWRP